ncbi:hypothetical protein MBLNU459_g6505t1 [Dothideomycetes sp. NU459]
MAALPLGLTVPAATATLAYLDARTGLSTDLALLRSLITGALYCKRIGKQDKVNLFYELENQAHSTKNGNRPFIAVPPTIPKSAQLAKDLEGLESTEWTYKQVYDTVLKFAQWLKQEHGVATGDIVALNFTNKPQFVFLWFAIWSLGAKPAFLNTNLRGEALLHCVKASTTRLMVLDPSLTDAMTAELQSGLSNASVSVAVLSDDLESKILGLRGLRVADSERGGNMLSDMAVLIYTSGTTGLPKPAIVPWKKFDNSSKSLSTWLGVRNTDRYYTAMPLYHSSATILGLGVTLHAGGAFIISHHFSPRTFFASATASKATMMQYIGEMCRYLLSQPASPFDQSHKIRLAFGNGLRPDVWQQFKERFNITEIAEFYSATEAVSGSFVKSANNYGLGAVGRAGLLIQTLLGSASAIVKHDVETGEPWRDPKTGLCERVEVGQSGEMMNQLDPANIADKYVGYFNNAKASNSKILRDVLKKGDAWYRTGDLLRSDSEGRLFFVDRIGDTYRWKSENVSTNEVAEALGASPHVDEVNVYGVQLPNHDGRAGCAAMMLKGGEPSAEVLAQLAQHARLKMPRFAVPLFLRVVKAFEVTGTNKYTKHGLRTQGVDPEKTSDDLLFWLPPGAEAYRKFGKKDWESIVGGGVKL